MSISPKYESFYQELVDKLEEKLAPFFEQHKEAHMVGNYRILVEEAMIPKEDGKLILFARDNKNKQGARNFYFIFHRPTTNKEETEDDRLMEYVAKICTKADPTDKIEETGEFIVVSLPAEALVRGHHDVPVEVFKFPFPL